LFPHFHQLRAQLRGASRIILRGEEEGWNWPVRLGEAPRDRLSDLSERDVLEVTFRREPLGRGGSAGATRRLGVLDVAFDDAPAVVPGRLKRSLLGPYFRWTGVDGMVNPFGLEVIANPDLLPFERPFVAAHEWGHLAGYANEAEANFVGWLTCVRASPRHQYSGWFYLYWQISGEVSAQDRAPINSALAEGPRRDVNAVITRLRRGEIPALQQASWQVYDKYLKANRVEAGVRSYGEVVTLLLRARFEPGWTPVRRAAPPALPAR